MRFDRSEKASGWFHAAFAVLAVGLGSSCPLCFASAQPRVTLESLLDEMCDADAATRLSESPWTGKLWSSRDRRSVSVREGATWFANNDYSQFVATNRIGGRTECVMVDAKGPGALTRLWTANGFGTIYRFYVDGASEPVVTGVGTNLVGGHVLCGAPLADELSASQKPFQRAQDLYLPIPFAKSLVVTAELRDIPPDDDGEKAIRLWYNAEVRTYAEGTPVESFSSNVLLRAQKALARANAALRHPPAPETDAERSLDGVLGAHASRTVEFAREGAVRRFSLKLKGGDEPLRKVRVKMTFDGETTVDASVGQLFAAGYAARPFATVDGDVRDDGRMTLRAVMPFARSCTVTLTNTADAACVVRDSAVAVGAYRWDAARSLHFGAFGFEERDLPTRRGAAQYFELNWVELEGKGFLVGNTLATDNSRSDRWWGEGDEKIYLDGETFPTYFGTGTEDFFGYSWGCDTAFTGHPFLALPCSEKPLTRGRRLTTCRRVRRLDRIPFATSLRLDVEVWHWDDCKMHYAPATFWYARPGVRVGRRESFTPDSFTPGRATLQLLPPRDVRVTGGYWFDRIETNRTATLNACWNKCRETPRLANFENAAKRQGKFGGIYFDDSDVYKVMEGTAYILSTHPDSKREAEMDALIATMAKAQEEDGYLYTARTLGLEQVCRHKRWEALAWSHELYNQGHMIEAAVAWHQATGKTNFLAVARNSADLMCRTFGPGEGQLQATSGHEEIELALCRLFRETGEKKYLDLARFFLDMRGRSGRAGRQDHLPVLEQTEAVGHAVRATYLYCGMADVAVLDKDPRYAAAIDRLWENVVSAKLHLNGGVGAGREYVHPRWGKSHECFGADYDLPNETAYLETCAAVGNALWNERMFLIRGEAKYVDVLERILYNGFPSGVSLSGTEFFYPNPLASKGGYKRTAWFGCSCCPVNAVRFIPQIPRFIFATDGADVYWNLFMSCEATIRGARVEVETDYPRTGSVKMTLRSLPSPSAFASLKIRIPGWAVGRPVPSELYRQENPASVMEICVSVNGYPVNGIPGEDGYLAIGREWKAGDVVEVALPMEVRRIRADVRVSADRGRVAIERGPVVYCAEGADNGGKAFDAELGADETLAEVSVPFGDRHCTALRASSGLTLVPYALWNNRTPGNEMQVWLKSNVRMMRP